MGVGLDGFRVVFDHYRGLTNFVDVTRPSNVIGFGGCMECFVPHNIYLEAVAELGIIGGALLFMIVLTFMMGAYNALSYFRERQDRAGEILALSAGLSFLGILVMGIGLGLLYYKYFWVSMAMIEVVNLLTLNGNSTGRVKSGGEPC